MSLTWTAPTSMPANKRTVPAKKATLSKFARSSKMWLLGSKYVPKINPGKQGKHILGHNNYLPGRSILTADPNKLAKKAGTGQPVSKNIPRGKMGFKERVDFKKVIGDFVNRYS